MMIWFYREGMKKATLSCGKLHASHPQQRSLLLQQRQLHTTKAPELDLLSSKFPKAIKQHNDNTNAFSSLPYHSASNGT